MRLDLPTGKVTFLFTDVEGSTKLLHEVGPERYAEALADHRRIVREAFAAHGGLEVDTQGDAFFIAFPTASGALRAAAEARERLAHGPIRVRMGIHTGEPHLAAEGYVGVDVHRAARIGAAGHGDQIVVSAATAAETGHNGLRELGEHRLKDFDQPVPLYQLGDGDFPPLKTISNTNLPRPASSFVGREAEVVEVASLLRDRTRLLTLTGPGGSGKTRLAIEAAATVVPDFKAGVFWVGLGPLRDPGLVLDEVALTLGAKDGLEEHIGERELLLLLDNLEQVVDCAPALAKLVEACPNLHLLVTSRELLRVRGEAEYPVLPLAEPDAVALFGARAGVDADEPVHELCRALDNLPLAVELAAASARVLTPGQMLERLGQRLDLLKGGRDADPRQATLRATIEWSYDLLGAEEQRLFARLAVFAGGCTAEAAEEVADADLDVLQSLVEKSLVRRTNERLWMLETIREYAVERLESSGEGDELRRRHAEHFVALAEAAESHMRQASPEWLDRIEAEHDNVRAALDWLEGADEELAAKLTAAVWRFWSLRGHLAEGLRRVEDALARASQPTAVRARLLEGAADLALDTAYDDVARLRAEEGLALNRELDDEQGLADCLFILALTHTSFHRWQEAHDALAEAIHRYRDLGDERHAMMATRRLAWTYENLYGIDRATELHEQNLRAARAAGDRAMQAETLAVLGQYALEQGRLADALPMLTEAYELHLGQPDLTDRFQTVILVCRFARALALAGRAVDAARLVGAAPGQFEKLGIRMESWVATINEGTLELVRDELEEAAIEQAFMEGRQLSADEAIEVALEAFD
ncbi:MAG TPA: adenylate/guanylate cyclase domain-containing protein [Gaiellaceae bacterium]|nr:adenylate/guanylate cyclase domain-containing protein [Gaiellaceae bacterium]